MIQQSQNDWPPSIPPFRDYTPTREGIRPTGRRPQVGSVGIVIPVRNGIKFFKLCFHSVISFTDHPFLLNVVDNMCDLDMRRYLGTLHVNYELYLTRYDEDFNFAAEVNLGLRRLFQFPEVQYGLILNADTVVSPGWLHNLMQTMTSNANIGAVGPLTNKAIPEQMDTEKVGLLSPAQRLSGMCMLIRRQAFEDVGGFDEEFTGGGFEDWDFCERIIRKGWHVIIDGTVYIHHFYKKFRRDEHDDSMLRNEQLFFKKHPLVHDLVKRGDLLRVKP